MLPPQFYQEIQEPAYELEALAELVMDSGTVTFSQTREHGTPALHSYGTVLQKLQVPFGKTNVSKIDVEIAGRDNWKRVVSQEYIKNRRVNMKVGPRAGTTAEFYTFFTGLITDFSTSGEILRLEIQDDLYVVKTKVPTENATNTQSLSFVGQNPIDIKTSLIETYGGIPSARIDSATFTTEKNNWFQGWSFERVLTKPEAIKNLLNELDEQTLNVVFSDGDKITCATFAPPLPGSTFKEIEEDWVRQTLGVSGGMKDHFVNKCVLYYDWDESGNENPENFDSVIIIADAESQGASQWDEVADKIIKSKWIRSLSWTQPANITGVVIYEVSASNLDGSGSLAYTNSTKTLTWMAPGDSAGAAVNINKDGKFTLYSSDTIKRIQVVITETSLPGSDQSDTITLTTSSGGLLATALATHWVARYSDPQAEITMDLPLSKAIFLGRFLKVSDIIEITTDRIITKGKPKWENERLSLTSTRPDFRRGSMKISGIQTAFRKRYGFIGPVSLTVDYDSATEAQKEYAFIGDNNNQVGAANEDGYYIW